MAAVALAILFVLASLLVLPRSPASPGSGVTVGSVAVGAATNATGEGSSFPTPIRHVFIVMLENSPAGSTLQKAPFLRHLADTYGYAANYYAICHPSAPNYLALTGGATHQCGTDAYHVYNVTNLGDLLDRTNRTWSEFAQSMPVPCDTTNTSLYYTKHNPFVYYQDIVSNATRCDAHVQSFTAWSNDLAANTVPDFGFFTPNIDNDGHNTGVQFASNWLHGWLSPLLNKSFFADSVFFVTFDESADSDTSGYNGTAGGHIYLAAVSPYARTGTNFTLKASHYNLLETVEWLLGLANCGQNDSSLGFPAMTGLFHFPTTVALAPASAAHGNLVTVSASGYHARQTATVYLTNGVTTSRVATGGTGLYGQVETSFDVPNDPVGRYTVFVNDPFGDNASTSFDLTHLKAAPSSDPPGGSPLVTGEGFSASTTIAFTIDGMTAPSMGPCLTNAKGGFSCTVTVPALGPGTYKLMAAGGGYEGKITFDVT
jgi:hypothetical protein